MTNAASPDTAPVHEGDILDGKYRVERVLGVGGMGIVVAATHLQLDQRVALKFLLPAALGNAELVARFAREARAAVRIQSEHVARVIDVGTLTTGSPYMVMEYLEGGDLAAALEARGPLPVQDAVTYVLEACEAIAEAHAMGVIHRDLKPANLFLARRTGRDPMVKVLDFGISKTTDAAASALTQTTAVMGSPLYMSPEQMMSSKDVDLRTDIWSLGVILYELLVGEPPFVAETMAQIVFMVTNRDAALITDKRADVPPELAAVVQRCLKRAPAERFGNVAELAHALVPFGSSRADVSLERISRVLGSTETATQPRAKNAPASQAGVEAPVSDLQAKPAALGVPGAQAGAGAEDAPRKKPLLLMAATALALVLIGGTVLWRSLHAAGDAVAAAHVVVPAAGAAEPSMVAAPPSLPAPSSLPAAASAAVVAELAVAPAPAPSRAAVGVVAPTPGSNGGAGAAALAPSREPTPEAQARSAAQAVSATQAAAAMQAAASLVRSSAVKHARPKDAVHASSSGPAPAAVSSSPLHMEMK